MASWEFPTTGPVQLRTRVPAGSIAVTAAATQTATVTLQPDHAGGRGEELLAATRVEFDEGTLSIIVPDRHSAWRNASLAASVEIPEGSTCEVTTASADTRCIGRLASIQIDSASGEVAADRVSGEARVRTASGDVRIEEAGSARVDSGSGDVWVGGSDGSTQVRTASGDVYLGRSGGDARVQTASGDVRIAGAFGASNDINAASGDISVAVAPGIGVYLDLSTLSGTVSSELEPADEDGGADMTLRCRTISGDIEVSRAVQPAAR
jgi:DUF4097 and DUF4098 domain-containing protein YvlB